MAAALITSHVDRYVSLARLTPRERGRIRMLEQALQVPVTLEDTGDAQ